MDKLLELLGKKIYELLKEKMGDSFEAFGKSFEDDKITEDDVKAKLKEYEIEETKEDSEEGDKKDTEKDEADSNKDDTKDKEDEEDKKDIEDKEDEGDIEDKKDENKEGVADDKDIDVSAVLDEGWLVDGKVDTDKILYEPLKDFIVGLKDIAKQADWAANYKIAILGEALKEDMYDIDDANKFINVDSLTVDEDNNIVGIKEAFSKLKSDKPHLFKNVDIENPTDKGFNPVDKKVTSKPRSYAEAVAQTKALRA